MGNNETHERRHGGRVESDGTVIVHGNPAIRGRVLDVGVGGLSLLAEGVTTTPELGTFVRLDVRFDGSGHWLPLTGVVVRSDVRETASAVAIHVCDAPPDFEDRVQDEIVFALEVSSALEAR